MIFKSEKTVNGQPAWVLDTDKQTITHIKPRTGEKKVYTFSEEYVGYHLHYVEEIQPERLQQLVDSGEIYGYLEDFRIKVLDAVNDQAQRFMDSDIDYCVALENGNLYEVGRIGNNCRERAKEVVYEAMVYV